VKTLSGSASASADIPSRLALAGVVSGLLLIALAYASAWLPGGAPLSASWAMVVGTALLLSSMMALGGIRRGRSWRRVVAAAAFLFGVLVACFGAALLLPAEAATGPYLFGLPLRAAIILLGVGIVPVLVLPLAFAADFADTGLDETSLARLRSECARLRDAQPVEPAA
jgi:hypothetical protein